MSNGKKENSDVKLSVADTALSETQIYSGFDFEKYNPDSLIGLKGHAIYKKMMLDEQIKAVVHFKRAATISRDYFFSFNDPNVKLSKREKEKRLSVSEAYINKYKGSFVDVLKGILSGLYNGFSLTEKIFGIIEVNGTAFWGLDKLSLKPFDTFRFSVDKFGNILNLVQRFNGNENVLDINDFIYFVHNSDVDDHYGQSDLRECYRDWFSKDIAIKFRNIWLERHATGWTIVTQEGGKSNIVKGSAPHEQLMNVLNNKSASTALLFPPGVTAEFIFPQTNVDFQKTITESNLGIAKSLLVPDLLGVTDRSSSSGSRSLGDTQLEAFFWAVDELSNKVSEVLNEQLFKILGDANWGDGLYPVFQMKPISLSMKMQVAQTWRDLIDSGSVTRTDADEEYLRDLLNIPFVDEQSQTQLDSEKMELLNVLLDKYRNMTITKEEATLLIDLSLPLNSKEIESILNTIEPKEPEPIIPEGQDGNSGGEDDKAKEDGGDKEDDKAKEDDFSYELDPNAKPESLIGKGIETILYSYFTRASKRVNFSVIEQATLGIEVEGVSKASSIFSSMLSEVVDTIKDEKLGTVEGDVKKIQTLKFNGRKVRKLKNLFNSLLSKGWNTGTRNAVDEIANSKKEEFTRDNGGDVGLPSFYSDLKETIDFTRLEDVAQQFFDNKSFTMAGNITDSAMADIKNVLSQGIKTSRSTEEIVFEIYERFGKEGLLTPEQVEEALGSALDIPNPTARLNTVIRTNVWEAVNEARYNYFTDPSLGDFVQALEYSSVLDGRVTQICRHLDNRRYALGDDVWDVYRPPNHFNCRSIVFALTQVDTFDLTKGDPTIRPQAGFG